MSCFDAFHYKSYGTFCLHEKRLIISRVDLPTTDIIEPKYFWKSKTPPQKFVGVLVGNIQLNYPFFNRLNFNEKTLKLGSHL